MNLSFRPLGLALGLLVVLQLPGSIVLAQRSSRGDDLESLLARAHQVVASCDDGEARDLLRNADIHGENARALENRGRPVLAAREARLARRLAERAIERCRGGDRVERRDDLERMLRRNDRRLEQARAWLGNQARPDPRRAEDLATASRQMDRAWEAFRAGRSGEALKHVATVRQILSGFPAFPDRDDDVSAPIARQIDLTDQLIDAMGRKLPAANGLMAARDVNARARNILGAMKPGQALGRTYEARMTAVRVWTESGLAADRDVTVTLLDANTTSIDELAALLNRRPSETGSASLEEARRVNERTARALSSGKIDDAWSGALDTSRLLFDLRLDLLREFREND